MMKRCFGIVLFLMAGFWTGGLAAQEKTMWKEMYAFHDVMSPSFHAAEVGNLQPLRERADQLLTRAKTWQGAAVPEGYDPAKTADTLKRLVKQCKQIKKAVKAQKSDAELTEMITTAHDIFHEIMEKCRT